MLHLHVSTVALQGPSLPVARPFAADENCAVAAPGFSAGAPWFIAAAPTCVVAAPGLSAGAPRCSVAPSADVDPHVVPMCECPVWSSGGDGTSTPLSTSTHGGVGTPEPQRPHRRPRVPSTGASTLRRRRCIDVLACRRRGRRHSGGDDASTSSRAVDGGVDAPVRRRRARPATAIPMTADAVSGFSNQVTT